MGESAWHTLKIKEIFRVLETSENGLTSEEAERRLSEFGPNELTKEKKKTILSIFLNQFKSFLIIILIIAALISFAVGETLNSIVILIILLINAFLGFFQEYKAEKAVEALKKMTAPRALVLRDGVKKEIFSRELVPGDIVYLEEGKQVPADVRIIESQNLKVDESILTGESLPVLKEVCTLKKEVPLSEMKNMAFFGTYVTYGHGKGVVVRTGMETEMGKIAELVQETIEEETPLKRKLNNLAKQLGLIVLFIIGLVFLLNIYVHSKELIEIFILAIAMAISAVPEGLPMVVTLTLALGMQAMAKQNAIVRKLMAVETLGATTVICSDKTGTLTKNEMTVTEIYANGKFIEVTGAGYKPIGKFLLDGKEINPSSDKTLSRLLEIGALCNNAEMIKDDGWRVIGDPTEGALISLAEKGGFSPEKLKKQAKFITEVPFSSERKMMSVAYSNKKVISYVKGAPEKIIDRCNFILENGKVKKITPAIKKQLIKTSNKMAGKPLRVLAFAYKELPKRKKYTFKDMEYGLTFVGFVGMIDPPREGVKDAIRKCNEAGIRVIMITGDHKTTAVAIAKEIGIMKEGDICITGMELEGMSLKELEEVVDKVSVFARVSPEHKVKILQALDSKGETVAMTGDGVNDAPALKRAHIGVAMGIKGTDVAKQASDMILEDDNFSTIVKAVESGRRIYDNIKKFVRFELAANFDEIAVISFAAISGLPLPLLPLQLLWINLVTDTIPATTLAIDPPEKDIMRRPPRKRNENMILDMLPYLLATIVVCTFVDTWLFLWGLQYGIQKARTLVFTGTVMFQLFLVFNIRSERRPFLRTNPFENKYLVLGVFASFLLQLAVVYLPPLQAIFGTFPLDLIDWVVVMLFALIALAISPIIFRWRKST
ncbi:MAG: calcium-translocating P-type ATPase, SERCA-type [Nanoarchaeota archaeon]|nr:calcium-translocating P-type ATPase, SERCA-type [Nanoarchaeota archaeon]